MQKQKISELEEKSNKKSTKKTILTVLRDERAQMLFGMLLLLFTLYLFLSFSSFFVTGADDQSFLYADDQLQYDDAFTAKNWTGKKGAFLAEFFINNGFGIASYFMLFFLAVIALRAVKKNVMPVWKSFIYSAFGLVWFSVFCSFLIQPLFDKTFINTGGKEGRAVSDWLCANIGPVGTAFVLLGTAFVFSVLAFDKTVPFLKNLFSRKPKEILQIPENQEETPEEEIGENDNPETETNHPDEPEDGPTVVDLSDFTEKKEEKKENPEPETDDENEDDPDFEIEPDEKKYPDDEPENGGVDLEIEKPKSDELVVDDAQRRLEEMGKYDPRADVSSYCFPSLALLKTYPNENMPVVDMAEQNANKEKIVNALRNYGVEIESIKATIGPTITLYEIVPKTGTRISKIRSLESDIMLSLKATGIRIIAPIPGKGTVGIEVPNEKPQIVSMHSVIASKRFQEEEKYQLPVALGRTITNEVFMFDLAKSPHLLVAGATGQGKSVGLNAIITSLLYKKHPAELKFVLVDPKMVEFSIYSALENHYMAGMPDSENVIITDSTKVIQTLNSLVAEMENRYKLLTSANCRNIVEYNTKFIDRRLNPEKGHRYLPYIVIVIDEFGDFIMVAGKEVETPIARITQKARAVGMHMILATQRPSVNIITGVIKANVPGRIAFKVASQIDSRTILDTSGANQLVGKGDLLYLQNSDLVRVQCAFVDTPEVEAIVQHIGEQQSCGGPYQLPEYQENTENGSGFSDGESGSALKIDAKFEQAARIVVQQQRASTSYLQQTLELGFNRAARIITQMEKFGIIGPQEGSKPRRVLVTEMELENILLTNGLKH